MNHTLTPWKVIDRLNDDMDPIHRYTITQANGTNEMICKTIKEYTSVNDADNAAFIVTACNQHDALIAENERLRSALISCEECLYANFVTAMTVEGRRAVVAVNKARIALGGE